MARLTTLLDQIDRLDQEATQGPWVANDLGIGYEITTQQHIDEAAEMNDWPMPINSGIKDTFPRSDAEFIALARTVLPALSRAVRAVMEDCQSAENLVHKDHTYRTEYDYGIRAQARAVMEAITDVLGADDD